ncbi:MAG: hypothetical protein WCG27_11480 [Pseudomonadota bacterium]
MIILGMLFCLGSTTPIHYLMVKIFPAAQNFRFPGRITIFCPLFIGLIFIWLCQQKEISLAFCAGPLNLNQADVKHWIFFS